MADPISNHSELSRLPAASDESPNSPLFPPSVYPAPAIEAAPPRRDTRGTNHEAGTRLQALALVEAGMQPKIVEQFTGIHTSTISKLRKKARERGYDPAVSKKLLLKYVADGARSGRPSGKQDG